MTVVEAEAVKQEGRETDVLLHDAKDPRFLLAVKVAQLHAVAPDDDFAEEIGGFNDAVESVLSEEVVAGGCLLEVEGVLVVVPRPAVVGAEDALGIAVGVFGGDEGVVAVAARGCGYCVGFTLFHFADVGEVVLDKGIFSARDR